MTSSKNLPANSKTIMDHAVRLLTRRNHTEKELRIKLRQRGYNRQDISKVILKCKRLKYIDDASTATRFVAECKRKCYGPFRIKQSMQQKGFSKEHIETALKGGYSFEDELKNAELAMIKKSNCLSPRISEFSKRKKLYTHLSSRGFSSEVIARVLSEKYDLSP